MDSLLQILMMVLGFLRFLIFVQIILSWLINFQILNANQPLVYQIWSGVNRLLEPIYRPIRNILPKSGGLDFAPLVLLLGIYALQIIIRNNMY